MVQNSIELSNLFSLKNHYMSLRVTLHGKTAYAIFLRKTPEEILLSVNFRLNLIAQELKAGDLFFSRKFRDRVSSWRR